MNKVKAFLQTCNIEHLHRTCITVSITMRMLVATLIIAFFAGFVMWITYLVYPPIQFPAGRIITIPEGATLKEIGTEFKERKLVRSRIFFEGAVRFYADEGGVMAGDYFFEEGIPVADVAKRVTRGEFGLVPVKVTVYEGSTIFDIATLFEKKFPKFDPVGFLELARDLEGYLFPDTYLFLPNVTEEQVIDEMNRVFYEKTKHLQDALVEREDMTFEEMVILASIIQGEAWKEHDQKLISGVLHNRLEIDMPLQVDAAFNYINGKNTYQLTYDDLAIDSLYNTYKYKGLPVGPINNPGIAAMEAAVYPEPNDYLFYLADRSGITYYAHDYDGHIYNKQMYMD